MIDASADINKQDNDGSSSLQIASLNWNVGVVDVLLINGAFIEESFMLDPLIHNMFLRQSDHTDTDTVFIH